MHSQDCTVVCLPADSALARREKCSISSGEGLPCIIIVFVEQLATQVDK